MAAPLDEPPPLVPGLSPAATSREDDAARRRREIAGRRIGLAAGARVRKSRFVRLMRIMLPLLALVLTTVVLVWPQMNKPEGFRLSFSDVGTSDDQLVMRNARFRGTDSENRPFLVTADNAMQDPAHQDQVILDALNADITLEDGTWLTLRADTGVYFQNERKLALHGNVAVFSDLGYEFHADEAEADLAKGTVESDSKVWGHGPMGRINANGLRVYERGAVVRFINGVKTTLHNDKGAG